MLGVCMLRNQQAQCESKPTLCIRTRKLTPQICCPQAFLPVHATTTRTKQRIQQTNSRVEKQVFVQTPNNWVQKGKQLGRFEERPQTDLGADWPPETGGSSTPPVTPPHNTVLWHKQHAANPSRRTTMQQ
jgi:hypothetical protein